MEYRKTAFLLVIGNPKFILLYFDHCVIECSVNWVTLFENDVNYKKIKVLFSYNVRSDSVIPRLPSATIDSNGNVKWNVTPRIVGGTVALQGEFLGQVCNLHISSSYVLHFF